MSEYRKNVQAMCDRLGLPNPIRYADIRIRSVEILSEYYSQRQRIELTDMNRAGMLFLQEQFLQPGIMISAASLGPSFQKKAKVHFAELWLDAREKKRALVMALIDSYHIKIVWREGEMPT